LFLLTIHLLRVLLSLIFNELVSANEEYVVQISTVSLNHILIVDEPIQIKEVIQQFLPYLLFLFICVILLLIYRDQALPCVENPLLMSLELLLNPALRIIHSIYLIYDVQDPLELLIISHARPVLVT
jgi:hypothetical protein